MHDALNAIDVADYIVQSCINDSKPISNLQLQKILYFCQEAAYRQSDDDLIADEFEAWRYGPVIPSAYRRYSLWGGRLITWLSIEPKQIPEWAKSLIDPVVEANRDKYPWALVDETHIPGHPWHSKFNGGAGDGSVIAKSAIRAYARNRDSI